jgi:hypothetical protein
VLISTEASSQSVQLVNAFPNLTFTKPLFLTHSNDGTDRIFVSQQDGLVKVFPNDSTVISATTFLNITSKLSSTGGEEGLLGLAFHPHYDTTGYFYVNYTAPNPRRTVVARYSVSAINPNLADPLSEFIIVEIIQPYSNHNGGMIAFGLDEYLYIGMGDGGSGNDPLNNGQDSTQLLGKILRIDVDDTTATQHYVIPPDNPFAGNTLGYREEIWVLGMRNPFRFSIDPVTSQLWAGDVGQVTREEVDLIERGKNFGWKIMEGSICRPGGGACDTTGLTLPIKDYGRTLGTTITGGYIYRGYRRPDLVGAYIYGDFGSGRMWMLRYENGQLTADSLLINTPYAISSFGVDQDQELYICSYSYTGSTGIYRFAPLNEPPSAFGLQSPADDTTLVFVTVDPTVTFTWWESTDPDLDTVEYIVEIDTVSTFNSPAKRDTLAGTSTSITVMLPRESVSYFWRSKATDGKDTVLSLAFRRVNISYSPYLNDPPSAFNLLSPPNDTTLVFTDVDPMVTFSWEESIDPNPDTVYYILERDTASAFDSPVLYDTLTGTSAAFNLRLPRVSKSYYWRVKATDGKDTVMSLDQRRLTISVVTQVKEEKKETIEDFILEQNFPNPFNPTTSIKYTLPKSGPVRLAVFNLLGQEVAMVYEGVQASGTHDVDFDSGELPSGIYFYRLQTPEFVATKKMVIAK